MKNYLTSNDNHTEKVIQKLVLLFSERAHQVEINSCMPFLEEGCQERIQLRYCTIFFHAFALF